MNKKLNASKLRIIASQVRRDVVRMVHNVQSGHPGGSLGVELFNDSSDPIDIGGMYFTDTPDDDKAYLIPNTEPSTTTIPAGGYLIIWCDDDQEQGVLHVSKKLKAKGESVILINSDGITVVDSVTYESQTTDISMGRNIDNMDEWIFYNNPTPGAANL